MTREDNMKIEIESPEERWFKKLVTFTPTYVLPYVEMGKAFIRFRDYENGNMYELKVREVKKRIKSKVK